MYRILILLFISTYVYAQQPKVDLSQINTNGSISFDTNTLVIDGVNNRVGIRTSSPSTELTVVGNIKAGYESATGLILGLIPSGLGIPNNNVNAFILWGDNATFGDNNGDLIYIPRSSANAHHRFYTANSGLASEKVRITGAGNVGIGTTSPQSALSLAGGSTISIATTDGSDNSYMLISGGGAAGVGRGAGFVLNGNDRATYGGQLDLFTGDAATAYMTFSSGGSERMRITSGGNVGIGTTNPSHKLSLYSSSTSNTGIKVSHYSSSITNNYFPELVFEQTPIGQSYVNQVVFRQSHSAEGNTPSLNILTNPGYVSSGEISRIFLNGHNGNVGIATTSPSYKLHVNGSVAGVGAYNNLSDVNYKKNINDLELGLDIVKQLRPITYNWINQEYGTRTNIGFIAQEVESVLPNIVTTADDNVKSMATTDLIPILTKAIQEQQNIIDKLKTQVQILINEINILKNN